MESTKMRSLNTLAIATATAILLALGCQSEAQLQVGSPPPPPPVTQPPPPADKDGDGVPDDADKCPDQKEDGQEPDAKDGCPNDDPDKDGVKGAADKCPDQPETKNDYEDDDGCPDAKPLATIVGSEIKIDKKVMFEHDSDKINMQESEKLLTDIADLLKKHAEIEVIEVSGHTDKDGTEGRNKQLAAGRAKSVLDALVKLGVEAPRLRAVGYSQYCPLDTADTPEAKEKNRRVQFHILKKEGKPTDVKWGGCDAATKKGMKAAPLPAAAAEKKPGAETKKLTPAADKKPAPPAGAADKKPAPAAPAAADKKPAAPAAPPKK